MVEQRKWADGPVEYELSIADLNPSSEPTEGVEDQTDSLEGWEDENVGTFEAVGDGTYLAQGTFDNSDGGVDVDNFNFVGVAEGECKIVITEDGSENVGSTGVQMQNCTVTEYSGLTCRDGWVGSGSETPTRKVWGDDNPAISTTAFRNFWPGTVMNYQITLVPVE